MKKLILILLFVSPSFAAEFNPDAYLAKKEAEKNKAWEQDPIVSPVGRYQLLNIHHSGLYMNNKKETVFEDETVAKIDTMTGAVSLLRYVDNAFVWVETGQIPIDGKLFSELPLSEVKTK